MRGKAESQVTLASRSGEAEKDIMSNIQKVPWWSKRTRMERRFVVLIGSLGVVALSLGVGLVLVARGQRNRFTRQNTGDIINSFQKSAVFSAQEPKRISLSLNPKTNPEKDYCFTKGCIKAAADILDKLNTNVDPCDDFYQFACGNFIENTVIPDDRSRSSMFSVLGDKLNEQVRGLLEGDIEAAEPKPFQMAKSVFQSCMNKERIEERGFTPLKSMLKRMGGWPLLEGASWDQDGFKWYEMVYKFRDMGYSVDYFVDFSVTTDLKNSSWRILDLDQPGLGMSREYLMKGLEDADVQAYFTYKRCCKAAGC